MVSEWEGIESQVSCPHLVWDVHIHCVRLLGKTVQQVPDGCALKEANGRASHVPEEAPEKQA